MLDRAKCEKMLVWDDTDSIEVERIVITVNSDGSCIAVNNMHEDAFLRGDAFNTVSWDYSKPIPEKKYRPMTNDEMRGFVANTSGVEYRHKSWGDDYWEPRLITSGNPGDWLWRTISPTGEVGEPQEFVVEVNE